MKKLTCLFFLLLIATHASGQSAFDNGSVFETDKLSSTTPLTWSGFYEFESCFLSKTGLWQPSVYEALNTLLEAYPGIVLPEESYHDLEDGQLAARWTQTVGRLDPGFSVYRRKPRNPSVHFTCDPLSSRGPAGTITLLINPVTVISMESSLGKTEASGKSRPVYHFRYRRKQAVYPKFEMVSIGRR
ncbi:TPA: hypothetical protein DCG86_05940 [Candidatus Marinimicrobia bacterium]|nr:hypothetical protein [Candidatus Neomarinimicrobiota bacterium]